MASDFHTHTPHPGRIELVDGGEGRAPLWSLPFHPWHTAVFSPPPEEKLRVCAALGELGFDRFRGALPWPEGQLALFRRLLAFASDWRKPVVLHAVGPLPLLFDAVKPFGGLKILLHGFARHHVGALEAVLERGLFVSLKPELLRDEGIAAFLKTRPRARVGLESDDDPRCDIVSAYKNTGIPDFEARADRLFKEFLGL